MIVTVVATVTTGNLAIGVTLGVLVAMVAFARRVAHLTIVESDYEPKIDHAATRVYRVRGELFFASSNDLVHQFDYVNDPDDVLIDMSDTDIWDASAVASLDAIRSEYRVRGNTVRISGLDGASLERLNRLSG